MTTSLGPRLCILLTAATLGGCFDPLPDGIDDDDATTGSDPSATSGTDPSASTTADPSTESTSAAPSTSGDSNDTDDPTEGVEGSSSGGDESSSSSGDESSSGGEQDVDPPSVSSMTPADGSTGVREDATVQLAFSEPMDTVSVEQALEATALEPFTLTWDDDGTTLTITPDAALPYAVGTSPIDTDALEYGISVGAGASDLAGNALDQAFTATFSTARRITVALDHDPAYTGAVVSNGVLQTGAGDDPVVGDHSDNLARRGFIGFSIAPLPTGILEIEGAELRATQWLTLGDPMPSLGTVVSLAHIAPEQLPGGAYASTPIASLGTFSDEDSYASDNTKTMNVTTNVQYDYDEGESHSQYRLSFASATNFNSTTDRLRYNDEVLEVTYLLP